MKKLFSVLFLLSLTSCSFFSSENIQKDEKDIQNASSEEQKVLIPTREKIIELEKKKFDPVEINNIKIDSVYISHLKDEYMEKYKSQPDLNIITRELNGLSISIDALMFLKGRCDHMEGKTRYYDGGELVENASPWKLRDEYIIGDVIDIDTDLKGRELEEHKKELDDLFSKNFSKRHLEISNTNSYNEVISLMGINEDNLTYSLEKYSLILILTGKKFNDKKEILEAIFKKLNNKKQINENHLTGPIYFYYDSNKECDGFFDYLNNEFNK